MSTEEEAVQQELFDIAKSPEPSEDKGSESPAETSSAPSSEQTTDPAPQAREREESIPSWRLREEAEARRVAEDRARAMEARLTEIQTHLQQQNRQQTQQKVPGWYEDPEAATRAYVQQYFQPIYQQQQQAMMQLARDSAEYRYGAENVALAEQTFLEARDRKILDPMDYERVVRAPNRYDACVQWYKRLYALHTVGEDPETWYTKRRDAELADPKFQAAYLEQIRGQAATRPGVTKLPPSLSRSTAAAPNGAGTLGDMSHESLWANAIK